MNCELCTPTQTGVLYQDERLSVILVDDPLYPGFCRVIWKAHVKEMSDLTPEDAAYLMNWVLRCERALRELLQPEKINLASLGNMVAHLHWHVIPRFADDAHFPAPVWANAQREGKTHTLPDLSTRLRQALNA
ncbi:HIT family protein [Craterilacuibacter sp.]|uniref:HIT family protein n=1 Tax=Craterilacuibacter sp. TaxID=2870909 RepID=UPI003F38DAF8